MRMGAGTESGYEGGWTERTRERPSNVYINRTADHDEMMISGGNSDGEDDDDSGRVRKVR